MQWLLIDATYLCHRAYHAHPQLSYDGQPTGVIYGFLRDIQTFRRQFATERLVFCWDHGKGLREQRYPFYKESRRKDNSPDKEKKDTILQPQISRLKNEIIPRLGYKNNYMQSGYEADDIIAKITKDEPGQDFTIISGDEDMYQLIGLKTAVYHPRKQELVDFKGLRKKYGIAFGHNFMLAKTIAGCSTDDIPGIDGIGIKTACKFFIMGGNGLTSAKQEKIKTFLKTKQAAINLVLIRLPFPGTNEFNLWEDERDEREYRKVLAETGIRSLVEKD